MRKTIKLLIFEVKEYGFVFMALYLIGIFNVEVCGYWVLFPNRILTGSEQKITKRNLLFWDIRLIFR
jgi:hypothetical protein